ncbi:unnamed protein product [Cercopithifilaria johnstoni]|uniref:C2H2-type domain-containing protein n=1 Tax=Cercopithifilaria johnstoni TaxID=2874296 RepID=A0A8J2M1V8_9BILA|nr:unnamed protein product [Cercopithifilaria johnstoni]
MPKRKTYLIASLLDECGTDDMKTIHCDTVKPIDIINKECEKLRKFNRDKQECSYQEEREQSIALRSHGVPWRKALPMPIIQNQIENFPGNDSSQYFLHRMPVQTHLQTLSSPYSISSLSQLMTTRYQLMQMQQAAAVHQLLSSPSTSSSSSLSLLSSTSMTAINQQISSNQIRIHHHQHHHQHQQQQHNRFQVMSNQNQSMIKKYRCDICDKAFSRSNTLVTHKRIHTGEKPFHCDHCGRAFRQPGNLTRHRLTHTTVKPYICSICEKAFNRASNLHTHMRTHSQLFRTKITAIQTFGSSI